MEQLRPFCKFVSIAGSIRRERSFINDIEIVAVPAIKGYMDMVNLVRSWKKVKGDPSEKYTRRILPEGVNLDLFFANEANLGCILLIRTGSAQYSKWMMGIVCRRHGYRMQGGYLWKDGVTVPVPDEETFYKLMKMPFVEPKLREI